MRPSSPIGPVVSALVIALNMPTLSTALRAQKLGSPSAPSLTVVDPSATASSADTTTESSALTTEPPPVFPPWDTQQCHDDTCYVALSFDMPDADYFCSSLLFSSVADGSIDAVPSQYRSGCGGIDSVVSSASSACSCLSSELQAQPPTTCQNDYCLLYFHNTAQKTDYSGLCSSWLGSSLASQDLSSLSVGSWCAGEASVWSVSSACSCFLYPGVFSSVPPTSVLISTTTELAGPDSCPSMGCHCD